MGTLHRWIRQTPDRFDERKKEWKIYILYPNKTYVYSYIILENNYKPDNIYLFLSETRIILFDTYWVLMLAGICRITRYLKQNCCIQHVKHKILKRHIFTYDKQYKGFLFLYGDKYKRHIP